MSDYRNENTYRNGLIYRGSSGVFQAPPLRQNISVSVKAAIATNVISMAKWAATKKAGIQYSTAWENGHSTDYGLSTAWDKALPADAEYSVDWLASAAKLITEIKTAWGKPLAAGAEVRINWQQADAILPDTATMPWSETYRADTNVETGYLTISHRYEGEFYRNKENYRSFWKYRLENRQLALDNSLSTGWGGYTAKLNDNNIPWGDGFHIWGTETPLEWTSDTSPIPDQPAPAEPEISEFYNVATDLTVIDVATQTPLSIDSVSISLDIDSFAWTLTARVLNRASMNLAAPSKLIEVSTMGWAWVFLVESYTSTRGIATTWQINASSQSRMLDAPWQDASSHIDNTTTTWQQAVSALMPVGWEAVVTKIDDYTIPAGAWSYNNKTPKEALSELLETIGAVAIPDMATKKLHIQPRYKYAPWEYNLPTTEPDAIIHEAMILSESGQYRPANQHNGVWVSGNNQHGVIVEVMRYGTDGLPQAQDVYHELITDAAAGRQKGKQIIAASGSKTLTTIETIITDEQASPGLVLPGSIVEVVSDGETWRGLCLSVGVEGAGLPAITQTLTIERDHGDHS